MNKLKKLVVVALSLVMALALAVPTFADEASDKAKLKAYIASYGIDAAAAIDALTPAQLETIKSDKESLQAKVDNTAAAVKADPANAQTYVNSAVAEISAAVPGVEVNNVVVNVSGDKVSVNATVAVNGAAVPAGVAVVPNVITTETVENNVADDSSSTTSAVAANPLTSSSTSVIKATGDNSAVVVIAAALAVVAVLGLGFRKNSSIAVA